MIAVKDLARELRLHRVSIAEHCRNRGIETFRRLPEGATGGQLIAHLSDEDAGRIRENYRDRVAKRRG